MALATAPGRTFDELAATELRRGRALWAVVKRKPLGMASAALILLLVFTAIFADVLAPYDPLAAQPEIRLAPPS
jgi:peptide/nickel transport system permease protein